MTKSTCQPVFEFLGLEDTPYRLYIHIFTFGASDPFGPEAIILEFEYWLYLKLLLCKVVLQRLCDSRR